MTDIAEKLIENSSLTLVVIGLLILVIGATGGWTSPSLTIQVNEIAWQIALSIVGAIVTCIGILPFLPGQVRSIRKYKCKEMTTRSYFSEPIFISATRNNQRRIDSDFILWEQCTLMIWVLVPPKDEGLRDAPTNRYILAHHTGRAEKGKHMYYNQFCLRYSRHNKWQVTFSSNEAEYPSSSPAVKDGLTRGWHHFLISWERSRPKLVLLIDGGISGSDIITSSFSSWPERTADKAIAGAWPSGHYCETKLFNLVIVNRYLEPTDDIVTEHLQNTPNAQTA